jgi:hypothetical protein
MVLPGRGTAADHAGRDRVSAADRVLPDLPARGDGRPARRSAAGAFGLRLTALIGLLHGGYHLSMRTTVDLLADICGVDSSVGGVAARCVRVTVALAPTERPYLSLFNAFLCCAPASAADAQSVGRYIHHTRAKARAVFPLAYAST